MTRSTICVFFSAMLLLTQFGFSDSALDRAKERHAKTVASEDAKLAKYKLKRDETVQKSLEKLIKTYEAEVKSLTRKGILKKALAVQAELDELNGGQDISQVGEENTKKVRGGLLGSYHRGKNEDVLEGYRIDTTIDFSWGKNNKPHEDMKEIGNHSCRWVGWVHIIKSRKYMFRIYGSHASSLKIDGTTVVSAKKGWADGEIQLSKGFHPIEVTQYTGSDSAGVKLAIVDGSKEHIVPSSMLYYDENLVKEVIAKGYNVKKQ